MQRTGGALPWEQQTLLGENQGENSQTFGQRHADDGLNEDLGGSAGVAADGFSGLEADKADTEGGAEHAETDGDVAGNASGGSRDFSSEEEVHWMWCFILLLDPSCAQVARSRRKILVRVLVMGVIAALMIAEQPDVNRAEQREDQRLHQSYEQLHKIEDEDEARAMEQIFAAKHVAKQPH